MYFVNSLLTVTGLCQGQRELHQWGARERNASSERESLKNVIKKIHVLLSVNKGMVAFHLVISDTLL